MGDIKPPVSPVPQRDRSERVVMGPAACREPPGRTSPAPNSYHTSPKPSMNPWHGYKDSRLPARSPESDIHFPALFILHILHGVYRQDWWYTHGWSLCSHLSVTMGPEFSPMWQILGGADPWSSVQPMGIESPAVNRVTLGENSHKTWDGTLSWTLREISEGSSRSTQASWAKSGPPRWPRTSSRVT